MLKNIMLATLYLVALGASHTLPAAEEEAGEAVSVQALPEESVPVQATPADAMPLATDPNGAQKPAIKAQPLHDGHTDFRYCLDLKTNLEIAACRYKKK